ncbi:MAG: glycosyltransferase [Desulfuromonadales bacterium]|nr:glycosyltransferase [Desulfuromonadales bacterium]
MTYGIVVPVHNEGLHLEESVTSFLGSLPQGVSIDEFILVENGSKDNTLDVCNQLARSFPTQVRVLTLPRGSYGEAIKRGMLECHCTHLSILECDFLDAGFVAESMKLFRSDAAQFIVASKRHPDSIDRRPLKRRILTALYNFVFLRVLLGYPGTDTHGLKSIEISLAKKLCELAVTSDEVFQTEIVLIAWKMGIKIVERPIQIIETRPAPVSVRKRLPKVLSTVRELKQSLKRFKDCHLNDHISRG